MFSIISLLHYHMFGQLPRQNSEYSRNLYIDVNRAIKKGFLWLFTEKKPYILLHGLSLQTIY